MEEPYIYLSSPHMSEEGYEMSYIQDAFRKNFIAPLGENVNEFEHELVEFTGAKYGAALSSGTAAIQLALKAIGIQPNDYVLVQDLTFSATVNPILYERAIPIFIDSEVNTWNMCPKTLRGAIQHLQRKGIHPKAVIIVHLYGIAASLDELISICKEYQIPMIEDAAESLGTLYSGEITDRQYQYTGTFGDYGIFSFNGNKIITTSGGGMLVSNLKDDVKAKEKVEKVRFWATQARDPKPWYQHSEIGYNYRMSNICAGIGRGQLKVLNKRVKKKQWIYNYYKQQLGDIEGLGFMPVPSDNSCNCWLTVIQIKETLNIKPLELYYKLQELNIESRPVWKPMHLQPIYAQYDFYSISNEGHLLSREDCELTDFKTGADNSISGNLFAKGLCVPSDTKLDSADLERICGIIRGLLN